MQTRKQSAVEAVMNILVGCTINMAANFLIFPFFGWEISATQNVTLCVIYTAISFARSY
jgi:chemotaxis protein CheY-P-specific phosphatase CheC